MFSKCSKGNELFIYWLWFWLYFDSFLLISFDKNSNKLNNKISDLKSKFDKARSILSTTDGIDMSYMEQTESYNSLLNENKLKLDLLNQYKQLCEFQIKNNLENNTISNMNDSSWNGNHESQEILNPVLAPAIKQEIMQNQSFDLDFE